MKKWIRKSANIFCSNKGETLVESMLSLLIMSILMISVTTIIQTAFRITNTSTRNAESMQEDMNLVMLSNYDASDEVDITFTYSINGAVKTVSHKAQSNKANGILAFTPADAPEVGGP